MSKSKNFTLRLSEQDEQVLDSLAQAFDTDRSATVRRTLRIALRSQTALNPKGVFTPANTPDASISVSLADTGADDER
jgi:hypothetical protein